MKTFFIKQLSEVVLSYTTTHLLENRALPHNWAEEVKLRWKKSGENIRHHEVVQWLSDYSTLLGNGKMSYYESYQSWASEASEAWKPRQPDNRDSLLMDSTMAGPISVKLSGVHEGRWEIVLGQKKNWFRHLEKILEKKSQFFCLQPNPTSPLHAWRLSWLWGLSPCDTST